MIERVELTECIVDTVDGYVALAARIGPDAAWRSEVAGNIVAGRHKAYDDRACIEGLEAFLLRAAKKGFPFGAIVNGQLSGVMQSSPSPDQDGEK